MSIYAFLNCHDCKQNIFLGKALHNNDIPFAFHTGNDLTPQWQKEETNKVLWKFLADHTAHTIDVLLEHQMSEEMHGYQSIGGDAKTDISIENYLKDWQYRPNTS